MIPSLLCKNLKANFQINHSFHRSFVSLCEGDFQGSLACLCVKETSSYFHVSLREGDFL